MTAASLPVYDSAQPRTPVITELRHFWRWRGLLRLLVVRDLTVRYKRSVLGVSWTLLNPLLTTVVLWAVFSNIFRLTGALDVPFIVYLLSGILLTTYFSQGVLAGGGAILNSANVLTKVHVPGEVFSLAAVTASAINMLIGLVPLLLLQLVLGVGIPWTAPLAAIPILAMLLFVTGLGLLVAAAASYFHDVMDLTSVLVTLIAYLTPAIYPLEIVPEHLRIVVLANPLYSHLTVLRGFIYGGEFAPAWNFAVMGASSAVALAVGVWTFSRAWGRLAASL